MELKERIDEIWKSNPKIPFMQSKDILKLGYIYGENDTKELSSVNTTNTKKVDKNPKPEPKDETEEFFAGTTKELIEYTGKVVNKRKKFGSKSPEQKIVYIKATELDIAKARLELLDTVVKTMNKEHDLIKTYETYVRWLNEEKKKVKMLQDKQST